MRKETFFKNCEVIIRIPATQFLHLDWFHFNCDVLALPLYTYIGIEKSSKNETEFLTVPARFSLEDFNLENIDSSHLVKDQSLDTSILILARGNPITKSLKDYFNLEEESIQKFKRNKLKVWSEVPPLLGILDRNIELGLAIVFQYLCKGEKIESLNKRLKRFKNTFSNIQKPKKIDFLLGDKQEVKKWKNKKKKALKKIKDLLLVRILFRNSLPVRIIPTNLSSEFCSLLSIKDLVLHYHIPRPSDISIKEENLYSFDKDIRSDFKFSINLSTLNSYFGHFYDDEPDVGNKHLNFIKSILNNGEIEIEARERFYDSSSLGAFDYPESLSSPKPIGKKDILIASCNKIEDFLKFIFQDSIASKMVHNSFNLSLSSLNNLNFQIASKNKEPLEFCVSIASEKESERENMLAISKKSLNHMQYFYIITVLGNEFELHKLFRKYSKTNKIYTYYFSSGLDKKLEYPHQNLHGIKLFKNSKSLLKQ